MRRVLLTLALMAATAWAAPAFVQGKCALSNVSPVTSIDVTLPSGVAAGDMLIVTAVAKSTSITITASDTLNGALTGSSATISPDTTAIFYLGSSAAGSDTITVTFSTAAQSGACVAEYSGMPATAALDAFNTASCYASPCSSANLTTSKTDLIISTLSAPDANYGSASAPNAPYTTRADNGANNFFADAGTAPPGTVAGASWTIQFGGTSGISISAAFEAGATPPPVTMVPRHHGGTICCGGGE